MNTKTLFSKVAGVTLESRQDVIEKMIGNELAQLRPEPDNKYDSNAIAVWVAFPPEAMMEAAQIGCIPRELAEEMAPFLDGESLICEVSEITGGFLKYDGSVASLGVVLRIEYPTAE